jgi:hypothetical protein
MCITTSEAINDKLVFQLQALNEFNGCWKNISNLFALPRAHTLQDAAQSPHPHSRTPRTSPDL